MARAAKPTWKIEATCVTTYDREFSASTEVEAKDVAQLLDDDAPGLDYLTVLMSDWPERDEVKAFSLRIECVNPEALG